MSEENVEIEEQVEEVVEEIVEGVADGEDVKQEEVVEEAWMAQEDDDGKVESVPFGAFVKEKNKFRDKISESNAELDRLRKENEQLKLQPQAPDKQIARPRLENFETDEEYYKALDKFEDETARQRLQRFQQQEAQKRQMLEAQQSLQRDLQQHYERADVLTKENGISPEVYKQADEVVRNGIDSVAPNMGNFVVDQMISKLGEGSEKVMYYLGRNATALQQLQNSLASDPTGMKAAVFLGRKMAELSKPKKQQSKASPPPSTASGDEKPQTRSEKALKKAYQAAHKSGNATEGFRLRQEARRGGYDVGKW